MKLEGAISTDFWLRIDPEDLDADEPRDHTVSAMGPVASPVNGSPPVVLRGLDGLRLMLQSSLVGVPVSAPVALDMYVWLIS